MPTLADAIAHYKAQEFRESERELVEILSANDSDSEAWYYLGLIAFNRQDNSLAIDAFVRSAQLDSENANAIFYLGEVNARVGSTAEAVGYYKLALEKNRKHAGAKARLAQLASTSEKVQPVTSGQASPSQLRDIPPPPVQIPRMPPGPATRVLARSMREAQTAYAPRRAPQQQQKDPTSEVPKFAVEPAPKGIIGRVVTVQPLSAASLRFRLEPEGEQPAQIEVEMRGQFRRGSIDPGDWVQLPVDQPPDRPLEQVTNLTTGTTVKMTWVKTTKSLITAFVILFSLIWGLILTAALGLLGVLVLVVAVGAVSIIVIKAHR
jgi:hypothetical protein